MNLLKPDIPPPKPVTPMPDPESPGALAARRRTQSDILSRAGRSSTILSDGARFDNYSGTKTGGAG